MAGCRQHRRCPLISDRLQVPTLKSHSADCCGAEHSPLKEVTLPIPALVGEAGIGADQRTHNGAQLALRDLLRQCNAAGRAACLQLSQSTARH